MVVLQKLRIGKTEEDQIMYFMLLSQTPLFPRYITRLSLSLSLCKASLQYGWMRMEEEWDELRKEARKIEGDLDVRLSSYAKLGGTFSFSLSLFVLVSISSWVFFFFFLCWWLWIDWSLPCYSSASGYSDSRLSTESNGGEMAWKSMEMEIESLLEKLLHVNDAMGRCASASVPTTSISQKLTRHCDILHEFTQVHYIQLLSSFFFLLLSCSSQCSFPLSLSPSLCSTICLQCSL